MRFVPNRTAAFLFLLLALVSLTGVLSTASALVFSDEADACCDHRQHQEPESPEPWDEPCPSLECSCLSCLSLNSFGTPSLTFLPSESKTFFGPMRVMHPSDFVISIEYPPETA